MDMQLPPISASLVLECAKLEVFREQFGMLHCVSRTIGPMRKKLGPCGDIGPSPSAEENARHEARALLAGLCRVCPHTSCKMKKWGMG